VIARAQRHDYGRSEAFEVFPHPGLRSRGFLQVLLARKPIRASAAQDVALLWVPKMPSESFRPEYHQIDEFNFDSAFVNSDNSASHSLGQTNLRKIRPSFRDGPFALFKRINLIAPSRFLRLDLSSISIREHN
jgi:hypothetical protein